MTWKFRIVTMNVFTHAKKFRQIAFDKTSYTWSDAWHKVIDESIKGLSGCEVVVSIDSLNDIVRVENE